MKFVIILSVAIAALISALPVSQEGVEYPLEAVEKIRRSRICPRSSSSTSSVSSSVSCFTVDFCRPCDAIKTVIDIDNEFLHLLNQHNYAGVNVLTQPDAKFAFLDEYDCVCLKQSGCLKNLWSTTYDKNVKVHNVIQSVNYNEDGSVTVKSVEVAKYKKQSVTVRDVERIYTSHFACNYKLQQINAVSFLCRTN